MSHIGLTFDAAFMAYTPWPILDIVACYYGKLYVGPYNGHCSESLLEYLYGLGVLDLKLPQNRCTLKRLAAIADVIYIPDSTTKY